MSRTVLDPTAERSPAGRTPLPRVDSLDGQTVALVDISKPRGNVFLDELEALLGERGATVLRFRKPTYAKPAPADLRHEIAARATLVVQALAD